MTSMSSVDIRPGKEEERMGRSVSETASWVQFLSNSANGFRFSSFVGALFCLSATVILYLSVIIFYRAVGITKFTINIVNLVVEPTKSYYGPMYCVHTYCVHRSTSTSWRHNLQGVTHTCCQLSKTTKENKERVRRSRVLIVI